MRAYFEEQRVPRLDDLRHGVEEQHWLPNITVPVPRIQFRSRQNSTGHGREEWRRCRPRPEIAQALDQLRLKRLHFRAMERHLHLQGASEQTRCGESPINFG